jgi:hypothetical protein
MCGADTNASIVGHNIFRHSIGGRIVLRYELPNFIKVEVCLRVEVVPGRECCERRAAHFALRRATTSSPEVSFALPLLMSS